VKCCATCPQTNEIEYSLSTDEKQITISRIIMNINKISESSMLISIDVTLDFIAIIDGMTPAEIDQIKDSISIPAGTKILITYIAI
jgi:hypothetical protein